MAHLVIHRSFQSNVYFVQNYRAPFAAITALTSALKNCPARTASGAYYELLVLSFHAERPAPTTHRHIEIGPRLYFKFNLTALGEILQCFRYHLPQFAGDTQDITHAATDLQAFILRRHRICPPIDTW